MTSMLGAFWRSPAGPPAAGGLFVLAVAAAFWTGDALNYASLCSGAYLIGVAALLRLPGRLAPRLVVCLEAACLLAFAASGALLFWDVWTADLPVAAFLCAAAWGAALSHWRWLLPGDTAPTGRGATDGGRAAGSDPDGDDGVTRP